MIVDYICEICGKPGHRNYAKGHLPSHFFCSCSCQNEWQKTREDIVLKNKDPEFRKKVSAGLKRRKRELGEDYHSAETKRKIGDATLKHWEEYDDETKTRMLDVLRANAIAKRKYGAYDYDWKLLSSTLRRNGICHRCGSKDHLTVHHIIPVKHGGTRNFNNIVVLCRSCHATVEMQQREIFKIIPDWNVIRILVRERLHCV